MGVIFQPTRCKLSRRHYGRLPDTQRCQLSCRVVSRSLRKNPLIRRAVSPLLKGYPLQFLRRVSTCEIFYIHLYIMQIMGVLENRRSYFHDDSWSLGNLAAPVIPTYPRAVLTCVAADVTPFTARRTRGGFISGGFISRCRAWCNCSDWSRRRNTS